VLAGRLARTPHSAGFPNVERQLSGLPNGSNGLMLLKKSPTFSFARFLGILLSLTDIHERFVGRSERSIFSPVN
jgi:hypothetical protein